MSARWRSIRSLVLWAFAGLGAAISLALYLPGGAVLAGLAALGALIANARLSAVAAVTGIVVAAVALAFWATTGVVASMALILAAGAYLVGKRGGFLAGETTILLLLLLVTSCLVTEFWSGLDSVRPLLVQGAAAMAAIAAFSSLAELASFLRGWEGSQAPHLSALMRRSGNVLAAGGVAMVVAVAHPQWSLGRSDEVLMLVAFAAALQQAVMRTSGKVAMADPGEAAGTAKSAHLALALGVSHEVRQPLFAIQLAAENARAKLAAAGDGGVIDIGKELDRVVDQSARALQIVERTTDMARFTKVTASIVELYAVLERIVEGYRPLLHEQGISITFQGEGGLVAIDPTGLEQVVTNALSNASDSIARRRAEGWQGAGEIAVTTSCCSGSVICQISDNGAGLKPSMEDRAFEPFVTTKQGGGGGLGLFLSQEIIAQAGGSIQLMPNDDAGATVKVVLAAA